MASRRTGRVQGRDRAGEPLGRVGQFEFGGTRGRDLGSGHDLPGTGRVPVLVPAAAPLERAKYPSTSTATRACPATVASQIRPVSDTGTIAVAALEPSIPSDTTRGPLAPGAPEPDSHPARWTRTRSPARRPRTPVFGSPFLPRL